MNGCWRGICYHLGRIRGRDGPYRIIILSGLHRYPHGLVVQLRVSVHRNPRYGARRSGRIQHSRARGVSKHWRRECSKVGAYGSTRSLKRGWIVEGQWACDWTIRSGW